MGSSVYDILESIVMRKIAHDLADTLSNILREKGVPIATMRAADARNAAFKVAGDGIKTLDPDYIRDWQDGGPIAQAFDKIWVELGGAP